LRERRRRKLERRGGGAGGGRSHKFTARDIAGFRVFARHRRPPFFARVGAVILDSLFCRFIILIILIIRSSRPQPKDFDTNLGAF
jgi:hypothetical protein